MTEEIRDLNSPIDRLFKIKTAEGERELDAYTGEGFEALSELWTRSGWQRKLSYEVTWLGIPIIQLPEDILILQELIWKVRPTVIVETGIAHGGALVLYASLLELLGRGSVVGIDVEIRKYNRLAIEAHPMSKRITMIEGSSVDRDVAGQVASFVGREPQGPVMVMLDSNHTREHVAQELELYSPLVTPGSYLVVFDGIMPLVADAPGGSPHWDQDNPSAAVDSFLGRHPEFEAAPECERLLVTYCRGGFLRRRGEVD